MTTVISLTIAGQEFNIDPADIAFWPLEEGSSQCTSGIAVGGVGPFYLATEWLVSLIEKVVEDDAHSFGLSMKGWRRISQERVF